VLCRIELVFTRGVAHWLVTLGFHGIQKIIKSTGMSLLDQLYSRREHGSSKIEDIKGAIAVTWISPHRTQSFLREVY